MPVARDGVGAALDYLGQRLTVVLTALAAGGPMMPRTMPRLTSSAGVSRSRSATSGT